MKSEYAIILSVILGGLLGFGFSYIVFANRISVLELTLVDVQNELSTVNYTLLDIRNNIQNTNSRVISNYVTIMNLASNVTDLQKSLSDYKKSVRSA